MNIVKRLHLPFDSRLMGISFYLPFLLMALTVMYTYVSSGPDHIMNVAHLLEFLVCPCASLWSVYLFISYYEDEAAELFFTYPLPMMAHGLLRVGAFFILYATALGISIGLLSVTLKEVSLFQLLLLMIPQALVYSALGFVLMIGSRHPSFPLSIIGAYMAIKFFTKGSMIFPLYNIMSFSVDLQASPHIKMLAIKNTLIAGVLFGIGQSILGKRKHS